MSEKLEENSADLASGASSWPTNLLKNVNNNDTDPIQATHPAVVAVCNVLMFDGPLDYKAWHCPAEHVRTRETMEQCISHLILQRRPSATPEWIEKLPEVSRRIEKNLYFSARSIDDYSDPYTLVNRIQELVKVLITSAATLPVPAPGTAAAEAFSAINKAIKGGEEEGSQEEVSSESSGPQKAGDATSGGVSNSTTTTEGGGTALSTGLAQLVSTTKVDLSTVPLYLVPLKEAELAQQQAAAALRVGVGLPPAPVVAPNNQVSSQGCSRVFIIKVLISVSEFVKGKSLPSIFTFKRELVMEWLIAAKQACCLPTYMAEEGYYGGPPFVSPDPSTHWSEPHQLYTWWKNNVERRSKFKVLQEDAKFKGLDPRRLQRARWCEAVVALSELIRASSGSSNVSRNGIQTTSNGGNGLHSSVASQMAHVPNPLTNSAAYIQALTASLNQNHLNYEDSAIEGTGNGNYYTHSMTLPSFAQIHLATTTDDDRSGIDALMSMSSFAMGGYGNADPAYTAVGAVANTDVEVSASVKVEHVSASQDMYGSSQKISYPATHMSPPPPPLSRGLDQPLPPSHLAPGLPQSIHLANPSLTSTHITSMNMNTNMNTGLAKPPPQLPLLSSFIPPANNLIIGTHIIPGTNIPYRNYSNTFPVKLFDLVSSEDETIVGWQGHGTSFQVRDMEKFVNLILPKHFKHNNFTSFQRQLNLYGFRRSASYDKGAYYHPQFQQGQRELAESIRRVLAPGSEGSGAGGGNSGSNSASALAMSYLSSLPPGATVQLPGVTTTANNGSSSGIGSGKGTMGSGNGKSYSVQELTGGDAAAESLLSMGAPITSMIGNNGLTPLSNTSAGNVAGSSSSDAAGYGFGGTFNMMSRLHQQHQQQQVLLQQQQQQLSGGKRAKLSAKDRKLLDMQQLGYNAEQFLASTTLSDRYTLGNSTSLLAVPQHHHHHHHHSHGHNVSGTGNDATKGNTGSSNSSSGRGRGRPAKKRARHASEGEEEREEEDDHEATYQDAVDGYSKSTSATSNNNSNKRKSQPSRRARAAAGVDSDNDDNDADSVSSASVVPNKQQHSSTSTKRASNSGSQSRAASYRNLTTLDAFSKSGLSRNSDISHLTRGADEDLIDLRNPHSRRVYLDFTLLSHNTHNDSTTTPTNTNEEGLDYVSGVYRGKLTQGKKDISLHYQLHGSRVLPEALLRLASQRDDDNLNDTSSSSNAGGSPAQSVSSFIAAQNKDNLPKATRVGKNYQCELPVYVNSAAAANTDNSHNNSTRRHTAYAFQGSVPVWVPNILSDECVNGFLTFLQERKRLVPLPVGSVLVVHLPEEKAYRLCCVLEVSTTITTAEDATATATTVRVFDGYEDWQVPIAQCRTFREGEIELALQLLAKHHGQISPELTEEVDGLLRTGACSEGRISSLHLSTDGTNGTSGTTVPWSAEEVQIFCSAVKRYGDNIKKVWSLRFASAGVRSLNELQEFFLTIYPHTQLGGAKRVVSVFARGQLAAAGRPNEEEEAGGSDSNEEVEGEEEGEGSESESGSSRSSSNSKSNSDCESGAEEGKEEDNTVVAMSAPIITTDVPIVAVLDRIGRKRGSVEDEKEGASERSVAAPVDPSVVVAATAAAVVAAAAAAAAAAKRRRR